MRVENLKVGQKAAEFLDNNYTCSQLVFLAIKDEFQELETVSEKMFAGFGGGRACTGNTCGTVIAATAIIYFFEIADNDNKNCIGCYKHFMKTLRLNMEVWLVMILWVLIFYARKMPVDIKLRSMSKSVNL